MNCFSNIFKKNENTKKKTYEIRIFIGLANSNYCGIINSFY